MFDHPVAVQSVTPKSDDDAIGKLLCTYYPDMMVRETGTDSPSPGPARIFPIIPGSARPPCDASDATPGVPLKTEDFSFAGRKGPFLFFSATDPNGAVPFVILDGASGRAIYSDGTTGDGFESVGIEDGALHLRYKRGVNGACSILKDGPVCWARMAREGNIPRATAQAPPPVLACTSGYRAAKAPADDPSIISYDVADTGVSSRGRTETARHRVPPRAESVHSGSYPAAVK